MNSIVYRSSKVEAYLVSEHAKLGTLPRHFGRHMLTVEQRIYDFMHQFAKSYTGGYWRFHELSNGGFFMAPPADFYELSINSNGFVGRLSAEAAGIVVCLSAFNALSFEYTNDTFPKHYYRLRDFALCHRESGLIFRAID